jgi:PAS domain S-box-containing protein
MVLVNNGHCAESNRRPQQGRCQVESNLSSDQPQGDARLAALEEEVQRLRRQLAAERALAPAAGAATFSEIADSIDQMIWSTAPDGMHDYFNRRWYEYTGVPEGSTDGEGWNAAFHPDDQQRAWGVWRESLATGRPYHIEYRLRHRSGDYRWVLGRAQPVRDEAGAIARWYGTCTDIHDLKIAEQRLRESEERLQRALDAGEIGEYEWDLDTGEIRWSHNLLRIVGLPLDTQITGEQVFDLIHPEDRDSARDALSTALETGGQIDTSYRIVGGDGVTRWIASRGRVVRKDGRSRVVGVNYDVTHIRRAEEALRESEAHLGALVRQTAAGIAEVRLDGSFISANERYCALVGRSKDELLGMRMQDITHPQDLPENLRLFGRLLETGTPFEIEKRYLRPDGEEAWVSNTVSLVRDQAGEPQSVLAVSIDITARRQAEDLLRRSETRLREESRRLETLNRTGAALAAELDVGRLVQMVTDAGVELTGAQFGAFFHNVTNEAGESYMLFTLSGAEPSQFNFGMPRATAVFHPTFAGEGVIRSDDITKDERYGKSEPHFGMPQGHLPVTSYLAVPVVSRSGEVIGGLFFGHSEPGRFSDRHEQLMTGIAAQAAVAMDNARLFQSAQRELASRMKAEQELRLLNETLEQRVAEEVAQRAQAEEALRQAQKMETLGQLTGGVAHDFNNLLQIVSGNIGLIQRSIPEGDARLRRAADNAARGAERAAVLTQRLLAFSRRQPLAPKPVDPNRLVTGMSELLHRTLGETVEVETVLAAGLWPVEVDANQLENAILNLAVNARDAMPEGGKLTIETANTHLDRGYVAQNAEVIPGQYVAICVSDTGSGMDQDTVARAFEPFFTTKEVGKGTGLGLSQVYGFVKQSGGHLKIYSEPGDGTCVKIYLPRLLGARPEVEAIVEDAAPQGARDETVLVCEDDDDVRAYTVEVLRELGYRVIEAHDGPSALRLLERQEGLVDLLFTDVVLPGGMTGAMLANEARALRPGLKVLFTTGYARSAIVHQGRLDPGVELITKPFAYGDLAARVREILDAAA